MNLRPTLRDIAARLGVSHTTVSLALRNDPRIPEATRKRARKAARELGYKADPIVSNLIARLRNLRTKPMQATLGFVTAWPTRHGWRHGNLEQFYVGAERRARELGYSLDEFWLTEPGMTGQRMTQILRARGIRGLILHALPATEGKLSLDWSHFACVTKGLTVAEPAVHRIVCSHYEDMNLVMRKLGARRYRRIGLALSEALSARVDRAWLAAFLLHQHDTPTENQVPALITRSNPREEFTGWMTRHRPEVILFSDLPVAEWVKAIGLRTPGNVGLVHLDWSPEVAPLAGLNSDSDALGVAATDLVVGQLHVNEYGVPRNPKIVAVRGRWAAGSSVRQR